MSTIGVSGQSRDRVVEPMPWRLFRGFRQDRPYGPEWVRELEHDYHPNTGRAATCALGNLSRRGCAMRSLCAGVPKLTSDLAGTWISGEYVRTCRPRRDASRLRLLQDRGAGPRSACCVYQRDVGPKRNGKLNSWGFIDMATVCVQ